MSTAIAIIALLVGPAWVVAFAWHQHRASRANIGPEMLKKIDAWRASAGLDGRRQWRSSAYAIGAIFVLWCFKPNELPLIILSVVAGAVVGTMAAEQKPPAWCASGGNSTPRN